MTRQESMRLAEISKDPDVLEEISWDDRRLVRQLVARNPNTNAQTLDRLSRDEEWRVRRMVARNTETPFKILMRLRDDDIPLIKSNVIDNPKFEMLWKMDILDRALLISKWLEIF